MSINKVILLGYVSKFQEVKVNTTKDGKKVANFVLTTSESWRDKSGEKKTKYENHRIVIWSDGLANVVEKYVSKGSKLYVEGALQTREHEGKYYTEVVLQGFNSKLEIINSNVNDNTKPQVETEPNGISDDIPF